MWHPVHEILRPTYKPSVCTLFSLFYVYLVSVTQSLLIILQLPSIVLPHIMRCEAVQCTHINIFLCVNPKGTSVFSINPHYSRLYIRENGSSSLTSRNRSPWRPFREISRFWIWEMKKCLTHNDAKNAGMHDLFLLFWTVRCLPVNRSWKQRLHQWVYHNNDINNKMYLHK